MSDENGREKATLRLIHSEEPEGTAFSKADVLATQAEILGADNRSILDTQRRIQGRTKVYTLYREHLDHKMPHVRILAKIVEEKAKRVEDALTSLYESHYEMAVELCPFMLGQHFVMEREGERLTAMLAGIVFRPIAPYFRLLLRCRSAKGEWSDLFFWDKVDALTGVENATVLSERAKGNIEAGWKAGVIVTRPPWLDKNEHPIIRRDQLRIYRFINLVDRIHKESKSADPLPCADMDVMDLLMGEPEVKYLNPVRVDPSKKAKKTHVKNFEFGSLVTMLNDNFDLIQSEQKLKWTCAEVGKYYDPDECISVLKRKDVKPH